MTRRRALGLAVVLLLLAVSLSAWLAGPGKIAPEARIVQLPAPHAILPAPASPTPSEEASVAPPDALLDPAKVDCPLRMADPVEGPVEFVIELATDEPGTLGVVRAGADVRDGALVFDDGYPDSLHRGSVEVPGYLRTTVEWTARPGGGFHCPEVVLRQGAVIVGTVDPPPREDFGGQVSVRGCDGYASVALDGGFYLEGAPEPCEVQAERTDGATRVRSDVVRVHPKLGEEVEVHLSLPKALQAGLGAHTEPNEHGRMVLAVRRGSAADIAGLRAGQVIVSVNGVGLASRDTDEYEVLTRGDVGEELVIEALVDGVLTTHAVLRAFVPSMRSLVEVEGGMEMRVDPDAWIR